MFKEKSWHKNQNTDTQMLSENAQIIPVCVLIRLLVFEQNFSRLTVFRTVTNIWTHEYIYSCTHHSSISPKSSRVLSSAVRTYLSHQLLLITDFFLPHHVVFFWRMSSKNKDKNKTFWCRIFTQDNSFAIHPSYCTFILGSGILFVCVQHTLFILPPMWDIWVDSSSVLWIQLL